MYVHDQPRAQATPFAGIAHSTWAGRAEGLSQLSVWRQTLEPGAATPPHRHSCDEVVLCLSGWGELHINGQVRRFGADQTVTLPRDVNHQLFNVGPMPLELIAMFAASPVPVTSPDGTALELPWRS